MGRFMDEPENEDQQPELGHVPEALIQEVVIELDIRPHELPIRDENRKLKDEQDEDGQHGPGAVEVAADCRIEPGQVGIGVPGGKPDMSEIDLRLPLCTSTALGGDPLAKRDVLFLRSLVPELRLV